MRLYQDGITRVTVNQKIISELKKAGYAEVKEPVEIPAHEPELDPELEPEKAPVKKVGK